MQQLQKAAAHQADEKKSEDEHEISIESNREQACKSPECKRTKPHVHTIVSTAVIYNNLWESNVFCW